MPKNYTIWLKSGGSVCGDITPKQEKAMKDSYMSQRNEIIALKDTEGDLLINPCEIVAIGINKKTPIEARKIGFKTGD